MADSIREALVKAYEAKPVEEAAATPEPTPDPEPVEAAQDVEEGIEASAEPEESADEPAATEPGTPDKPKTAAQESGKPAPEQTAAPADDKTAKAPATWKKEEAEAWATIPAAARAAIHRRELEAQRAVSAGANARRFQDEFQRAVHKYEPLMQQYGVGPITAAESLFATRAALELGTPEQKAQLVANIVRDFGIDIEMLDQHIVRNQSNPGYHQAPPPRLDPRTIPEFRPLYAAAEQLAARTEQAADEQIATISSLPHFDDENVRNDIASLLETAGARGRELPIRQAYDLALRMNGYEAAPAPAAAPNVSEAAAILAKSRKAASTLNAGGPRSAPKPADNSTIRGALENAFKQHA